MHSSDRHNRFHLAANAQVLGLTLFLIACLACPPVWGQSYIYATGSPTFSTAEPVELGFINLGNGNLHIEIPIASSPQRGSVPFVAKLVYDSRIWRNTGSGSTWSPDNVTNSQGGWRFVTSADKGSVEDNMHAEDCEGTGDTTYGPFVWTDPGGTSRTFPIETVHYNPLCGGGIGTSSGDAFADDSSGFHMYVTGYFHPSIYAKDGTLVYIGSGNLPTDTNGNYFSLSGANVVDTLGRTPVTVSTAGSQTTYAVLNSQGNTSKVVVTTTTVNYRTAFNQNGVTDTSGSFTAIQTIALPDGTSYGFTYDSGTDVGNYYYGLLKQITLPTGGTVNYVYTTFLDSYGTKNRWVSTRTPSSPGGTWTYAPLVTTGCFQSQCQQVTVTKPNTDVAVHAFSMNNGAWNAQTDYKSASLLQMTLKTDYDFSNSCSPPPCTGARWIRTLSNTTVLPSASATLTRKTAYTYDNPTYGNLSEIDDWLWSTGTPPPTPDRKTIIAHLTTQSYLDANIVNRPTSVTVRKGDNTWVSQTNTQYDTETLVNDVTGTIHWTDIGSTIRGNPTKIDRLLSSSATCPSATGCLEAKLTYDKTGQVRSVTDPKPNVTSLTYADSFYTDNGNNTSPTPYSPTQPTNAYLTHITPPLNGTVTLGYYFHTGKRAVSTDQNSATAYQNYYDSLDRLTSAFGPTVNGNRAWQLLSYPSGTEVDSYSSVNDTTASASCSSCRHDVITVDSMGRVITSKLLNDPDGATQVDTAYDSSGHVSSVSNPYRSPNSNGADGYTYDGINRVLTVTHTDGNVQHSYYGANVTGNGGISTQQCAAATYGNGYPTLFVDEANRKRQMWTDGFGRTIEVDEPDPSTGNISGGFSTCYTYYLLNNLKSVVQTSQTRTYVYDALSRVTSVATPEAAGVATTLSYLTTSSALCSGDPGLVCKSTDPRAITTTYVYDAINRLTSKTYSDSTPAVNYYYDQTIYNGLTITNGKGRRTGISDNAGSGIVAWSYDAAGRLVTEKRTIAGVTKTSGYTYAVGGMLSAISYPYATSPDRNVVYTLSNIGRPTQAMDTINSVTYVKNATYAPQGALSGYLAGNTGGASGITVNDQYNNRLQPAVFAASVPSGTIFSQTYSFVDGSGKNDGNLMSVTNNLDSDRTETLTYDYLNRLLTAQTAATSGAKCWGQNFTYDRYGNLYQIGQTKCSPPYLSLGLPNAATNRFSDSGFVYDAAGNMKNDGGNMTYAYNAENQMTGAGTFTMTYDGDGRRVSKSNGKLVWHLPGAAPFMTLSDSSGGTVKDMIFFAGRLVAQRVVSSGAVSYYFGDQVGSSRLVTDSSGTACWDADYYPFGLANVFTATNCLPVYQYAQLASEGQTAPDLDSGTFRYYSHRFARFMSPDPIGGNPFNPQTWNRYAYVTNNPLTAIDPLGLADCDQTEYQETDNNCSHSGGGGDPWQGYFDASNGNVLHPSEIAGYLSDFYDRETFGFHYYDLPGHNDEFGRAAYRFESIRLTGYDPATGQYLSYSQDIMEGQRRKTVDQLTKTLCAADDSSCTDKINNGVMLDPSVGNSGLVGGNYNFSLSSDVQAMMDLSGCFDLRCGGFDSLHFAYPGTVHLDTVNPWAFWGLGAVIHGFVDLFLGNTIFAGGIPR